MTNRTIYGSGCRTRYAYAVGHSIEEEFSRMHHSLLDRREGGWYDLGQPATSAVVTDSGGMATGCRRVFKLSSLIRIRRGKSKRTISCGFLATRNGVDLGSGIGSAVNYQPLVVWDLIAMVGQVILKTNKSSNPLL
jgi:hypothetical protein